ncbi:hypothetical protein BN7_5378 [Wickerhamomyces ciferrii]|uniref:Uncharacterized protein n=1 Tax=Wickerhamomyces ciferrii (strain ATCC 14091 / BCRC 22168 / CBS 111 / JCM 3599 / NBRC 0793 / NRRL Y-1031 F-60-10) TaxID=1206466 RepID=K0KV74_WICCF|nr:uncharacterized protein BN7_5378 [Wickerhamomyces ciferrii]CCH45792.1 hypothetical protein BN7_5378 [Wickerhamomyces ciferrii]
MSAVSVLDEFLDDYIDEDEEIERLSHIKDPSAAEPAKNHVGVNADHASNKTQLGNTIISQNLSIFQQSHQHNLLYLRNELRIANLQNYCDPNNDKLLSELNNTNFENLTKKQKRHLGKSNSKYILNFTKLEEKKSSNFGLQWHLAHRELILGDWERIKFLARG